MTIGVATKNIDFYAQPADLQYYFGYICCDGKKISREEINVPYGEVCVKQDKVGVLLEFTAKEAKLSFYRNNVLITIIVDVYGCSFWVYPFEYILSCGYHVLQWSKGNT